MGLRMRDPTPEEIEEQGLLEPVKRRPLQQLVKDFYLSGKHSVVVEHEEDREDAYYLRVGVEAAIRGALMENLVKVYVRDAKLVMQRIGEGEIPVKPEKHEPIRRLLTCDHCGHSGHSLEIATTIDTKNKVERFCISAVNCKLRQQRNAIEASKPKPIEPQPIEEEEEWIL